MANVLVDGRFFSIATYNRGVDIYVSHLLDPLKNGGHNITVPILRNWKLPPQDSSLTEVTRRSSAFGDDRRWAAGKDYP